MHEYTLLFHFSFTFLTCASSETAALNIPDTTTFYTCRIDATDGFFLNKMGANTLHSYPYRGEDDQCCDDSNSQALYGRVRPAVVEAHGSFVAAAVGSAARRHAGRPSLKFVIVDAWFASTSSLDGRVDGVSPPLPPYPPTSWRQFLK